VGYAGAEKEFCAYKLIEKVQPWLIKVTAYVQSGKAFAELKTGTSSMQAERGWAFKGFDVGDVVVREESSWKQGGEDRMF
jgi:hypothetical protein